MSRTLGPGRRGATVTRIVILVAGPYACKASVDMFHLERSDFIDQVTDIITVGEFYAIASGGQIVFT